MRRRGLLSALALAVLAVAPASCLSPTLPLPPPDVSSVAQADTAGQWTVAGDCSAGATVTVLNVKTGLGAVFEDLERTGFFSVTVQGTQCDPVQVWQELDENLSNAATVTLQATTNGNPTDPSLCH
jgi:hypothetical protein